MIAQVLYKSEGLKAAYPEYLYDKTSNVLLAEVLESGKGIPIALATLTMCVARRLGLPMSGSEVFLKARSTVGSTHFASAGNGGGKGLGTRNTKTRDGPSLSWRKARAACWEAVGRALRCKLV